MPCFCASALRRILTCIVCLSHFMLTSKVSTTMKHLTVWCFQADTVLETEAQSWQHRELSS